ncbi:MAG TPA: hypothetical protein VFE47_22425 [Tepidisphaeraceae bacterium]|jgi:hypothetical protein|nr:hypothetical protein [Tepidisphaeraceae bacterium]
MSNDEYDLAPAPRRPARQAPAAPLGVNRSAAAPLSVPSTRPAPPPVPLEEEALDLSAPPAPALDEIEDAAAGSGDLAVADTRRAARTLPSVRDAMLARKPLDYASPEHRDPLEKQLAAQSRIKDLYVPVALIIAGVILMFVDAGMDGVRNPIIACLYVVGLSLINILLITVAMLAAVKLVDVGLGTLGPAALKLLAVAIFPGAITGIVGHSSAGILYWGVALVLYFCMMSYLFEMDSGEIRVAVLIIWGLRFVCQLIIMVAISKLGSHQPAPSSGGQSYTPPSTYAIPPAGKSTGKPRLSQRQSGTKDDTFTYVPPPPVPATPPPETEKQAAQTIADGNVVEAMEWCQDGPVEHTGLTLSRDDMYHLAEKFYAGGAKKVWAANVKKVGKKEVCAEFIIEMPTEPVHRKLIMKVMNSLEPKATPVKDTGMKLLDVGIK